MKFYFFFLIFLISILPSCGNEGEEFRDSLAYFEEYYSNSNHHLLPSSSTPNYQDIKLIKGGLSKFATSHFFKSHTKPIIELSPRDASFIENSVSREVELFLRHLKDYLTKDESNSLIFNGDNFSLYISQSLERLFETAQLLFGHDDKDKNDENQVIVTNLLIDRYFRFQLMTFVHAFLLPLSPQNIDKYKKSSSFIRLNFFHLVEDNPPCDSMKTWVKKRQCFLLLDQTLRRKTDPVKLSPLITPFLESLKLEISQDPLKVYLEESYKFLNSSYLQKVKEGEGQSLTELREISLYYFNRFISLYEDYGKVCPDLFIHQDDKKYLLHQFTGYLKKVYEIHLSKSTFIFKGALETCSDLQNLLTILDGYILEAQRFSAKFISTYEQLFLQKDWPQEQHFFTHQFQQTLFQYFNHTLHYIEHQYEGNRSFLGKNLASLGWAPSESINFLKTIQERYPTRFPFLFDEKIEKGAAFTTKIKELQQKITAQEQESLHQTKEKVNKIKEFLDVRRWWQ